LAGRDSHPLDNERNFKETSERRDKTGMEERMEEPYIEGVATHDGPESCVGFREEVGEALTGVRIGWDIEP
jgi:hypothetical protein